MDYYQMLLLGRSLCEQADMRKVSHRNYVRGQAEMIAYGTLGLDAEEAQKQVPTIMERLVSPELVPMPPTQG
jgi:hypothetical protein